MTLLDVGGSPGLGGEWGALRAKFCQTHVVNIQLEANWLIPEQNVIYVQANGCDLPYPDKSFDWVFSNAVLEHVGGAKDQLRFCREMQRVARIGYFLSTPNRAFFLDPHTYLPFYHRMPEWMQRRVVKLAPAHRNEWRYFRLVGANELQEMLPGAEVKSIGPLGVNLVAWGREDVRQGLELEGFAERVEKS